MVEWEVQQRLKHVQNIQVNSRLKEIQENGQKNKMLFLITKFKKLHQKQKTMWFDELDQKTQATSYRSHSI